MPASLIILYLYHHWLKQSVISLLTRAVRHRLSSSVYTCKSQ
ncbi:hypothetical protein [Leptolyngbya sp. Heron Island J]